jgi:putative membrane-bound dehydrogenase-like protein
VLPPGFQATLFACDPLIEYPSAIALGPKPGTLFVAHDYMTGLGTEIIRRDEIRLIEDTDGDGYADKSTVYAGQFNSIEGLTFHGGVVYAMHAPLLTALRDTDGDGQADERQDIVVGLGLKPEDNPVRLHCANGLVMGHDGWLYLALGDHGCDVSRPEGDRLIYNGGGILRCRPDGRDLHVFASGLRNIYDVALDAELNVFVRDNENDGGDYKIRVCHSFFGADHGYPYLYHERPDEALPPLADLGLGSSAGGLCYLERQFPSEYQGNLIFCEWGRSVVHYRPQRTGGRFGTVAEKELARGAENDPYGFKPTDLVVDRDGSLLVADWADGQRPQRGRGRIYRIQFSDGAAQSFPASGERNLPGGIPTLTLPDAIAQLDSPSYYERLSAQDAISSHGAEGVAALLNAIDQGRVNGTGRMHAVWILAALRDSRGDRILHDKLFDWVETDPDVRVRVQAVRAIADLTDPMLVAHRLEAGAGDATVASRLARIGEKADPRMLLEIVVALGRARWVDAPVWLRQTMTAARFAAEPEGQPDPFLVHAMMQTLRQSANWPAVLRLLDLPISHPLRPIAVRAIAQQAVPEIVDGLIERLDAARVDSDAQDDHMRRMEYADALARVYKQPGPWVYWGYRPAPRPANPVTWERTAAIEAALDRLLSGQDPALRLAVLRRMQREKVPSRLATLEQWLASEREVAAVAAILESVREHPTDKVRELLSRLIADSQHASSNRLAALGQLAAGLDAASAGRLLNLGSAIEDGPVAAELFRLVSKHPQLESQALLLEKLKSPDAEVRTAAIDALSELRVATAVEPVRKFLDDTDPRVRRAATNAAGRFGDRMAIESLLMRSRDDDPAVRRASLDSLRLLGESRGVPLAVAGLADRQTQTAALVYLGELGGHEQAQAVIDLANTDPTPEVVQLSARLLTKWSKISDLPPGRQPELDRTVFAMQGRSGLPVRWYIRGPLPEAEAESLLKQTMVSSNPDPVSQQIAGWQTIFANGLDSRISLNNKVQAPAKKDGDSVPPNPADERVWLATTNLIVTEATPVQFLASSSGKLQVWLNGDPLFERGQARPFQADSERFDGTLKEGLNHLIVRVAVPRDSAEFQIRFRRKSSTADQETFVQAALARTGDAERGRKLFFDVDRVQCSKCHRIGDQGERIGPDLTGIGDRFSRIHIIESILEPSRTVTPGYQTVVVALRTGRVLSGVKIAETDRQLTLADNQGQKHELAKTEIDEQSTQSQSTMPDGLVKQLTPDQFVDLIAFLTSRKENPAVK